MSKTPWFKPGLYENYVQRRLGGRAPAPDAAVPPERPTYYIPAREVVPGMILCACEYRWPVRAAGVHNDGARWIEVDRGDYDPRRYGFRVDEVVTVQLPGPSPRELACTCWEDALQHDYEYRWEDEAIRQHGAACSEYAQRRAELATVQPGDHAPDCPVAPVPGRHGGMRLWPSPFKGTAWWWSEATQQWCCDGIGGVRAEMVTSQFVAYSCGQADALLQCFHLPPVPVQQPERRPAPAWDPYGTDLDLAVRYG